MQKLILEIYGARGYSKNQVRGLTVGELREMLEGYEDDVQIVTHDESNSYGASYGELRFITEDYEDEDDE